MTQVTIVKTDEWNDLIFSFINHLDRNELDSSQKKDLLKKYFEVQNVKFIHKEMIFSIEEINNCLLIIKGADHLLTIKFEL